MAHDPRELQAVIRKILRLAAINQDFRELALRDSHAAFARFDAVLPPDVQINFIENYGKPSKTIVLPDLVAELEELTDEDLEEVAGGCTLTSDVP